MFQRSLIILTVLVVLGGCEDPVSPSDPPAEELYRIGVVVHVLHHGEPVGEGFNLSDERIERQIEILNEDFRRRPGTPGFNDHPDGADARIEFVLAQRAPDGSPTDGIDRVDITAVDNPVEPGRRFDYNAHYGYWDHRRYLNVWVEPFGIETVDLYLGVATGPDTDLPGHERLVDGEPAQAEGVLINFWHFGESGIESDHVLGRTLTHEVGHYLGLLHLWGGNDCETDDYCDDTPPVSGPTNGCSGPLPVACDGTPALTSNYMDYVPDACMNQFTRDQVARMRHVLEYDRPELRAGARGSGRSLSR